MNVLSAALVVAAATAVAIVAMLTVRRRAPAGSFFADGDRAAGVYQVLATGFAVMLGFIVFLAFESYDDSRTGAEEEATVVAQQYETAQLLPPAARSRLSGELVCYARSVVGIEWPAMRDDTIGDQVNPWGVRLFRTIRSVEPASPSEASAYDRWLDQTSDREAARQQRIHGAVGVIPGPVWIVLMLTAVMIFAYTLVFADSGERAWVQGLLMGCVVVVMTSTLLLIGALDDPVRDGVGALRPTLMERTLAILEQEAAAAGQDGAPPCDARGAAIAARG